MLISLELTFPGSWPVPSPESRLDNLDEAGVVAACRQGTAGAFDVLVERHRSPVYQLCYRFVGNHEDASDLAQDVFIRAFRGLKTFKGQASLGTWLYRIAVNVSLNKVAAKGLRAVSFDPVLHGNDRRVASAQESPSDAVLRGE